MSEYQTPRIIRMRELQTIVGLSRPRLYQLQAEGRFPRSIKLGDRAVGWHSHDVYQWIEDRRSASSEFVQAA
jgi:prophage regulatory protein